MVQNGRPSDLCSVQTFVVTKLTKLYKNSLCVMCPCQAFWTRSTLTPIIRTYLRCCLFTSHPSISLQNGNGISYVIFNEVRCVSRSVEGLHSFLARVLKGAPAAKVPYISFETRDQLAYQLAFFLQLIHRLWPAAVAGWLSLALAPSQQHISKKLKAWQLKKFIIAKLLLHLIFRLPFFPFIMGLGALCRLLVLEELWGLRLAQLLDSSG